MSWRSVRPLTLAAARASSAPRRDRAGLQQPQEAQAVDRRSGTSQPTSSGKSGTKRVLKSTIVVGPMTTTSAADETGTIRPFTISIAQEALDDLQHRLAHTATQSGSTRMTAGDYGTPVALSAEDDRRVAAVRLARPRSRG